MDRHEQETGCTDINCTARDYVSHQDRLNYAQRVLVPILESIRYQKDELPEWVQALKRANAELSKALMYYEADREKLIKQAIDTL